MAPCRHLLSLMDLDASYVRYLLDLAATVKKHRDRYRGALADKTLGMIFEKPSTRTRISFEVGMAQLGGRGLFLSSSDLQLGRGETIADTAKVLSRYLDGVMARVFAHQTLVSLAESGSIPVINGLSDYLHPCQALADYLTLLEHKGHLEGLKLVYLGDGNNVAHSLVNGGVKLGVHVVVACPPDYEPDAALIARAQAEAATTGAKVEVVHDPQEAVVGADALYGDVWASMGQEDEAEARRKVFLPYQINEALFARAKSDAPFLHCLPAHRGDEVTDGVADQVLAVIFDEAENRLHAQKALLLELL